MAMVMRANMKDGTLGGHISSFQSAATLYDVGFNYFFRGRSEEHKGDLVYYSGTLCAPVSTPDPFLKGTFMKNSLINLGRKLMAMDFPLTHIRG